MRVNACNKPFEICNRKDHGLSNPHNAAKEHFDADKTSIKLLLYVTSFHLPQASTCVLCSDRPILNH